MICPNCKKEDPLGREMCPACGAPIKPIPVPPGGKIRFGKYDWYVLDKQDGKYPVEKILRYYDKASLLCGQSEKSE